MSTGAEVDDQSELSATMMRVYAPRCADTLADHLAETYGVAIRGVRALDVGVFRVDRARGIPWVARVSLPERPEERVRGDAEVLDYIASVGLPAERTACSDPVSFLGGHGVLVTEFVEGRPPGKSDTALRRLADVLGRVHALPADGPAAASRPGGSLHHVPGFEGLPSADLALAAALLDDIEWRVPATARPAFERLRADVADADDCCDLPHALVHPDPVPKNAITSGRTTTLIDWTGAGRGPRVASLALLLTAALRPTGWDTDRLDVIAQAYGAHVVLEPDEIGRLGEAVRLRQLWLASWNFWLFTARGRVLTGEEWWMPSPQLTDALAAAASACFSSASFPAP